MIILKQVNNIFQWIIYFNWLIIFLLNLLKKMNKLILFKIDNNKISFLVWLDSIALQIYYLFVIILFFLIAIIYITKYNWFIIWFILSDSLIRVEHIFFLINLKLILLLIESVNFIVAFTILDFSFHYLQIFIQLIFWLNLIFITIFEWISS